MRLPAIPAPALLALLYISWITLGALGLKLPAATHVPITWSDAFFTATSAVGLWQSLFHSISAFNNAGFSLFSDSLMGYVDEPLIIFTIAIQFIIGGLGFAVLSDILVFGKWRKLRQQSF